MSTISAGTTTNTALTSTGDTTGQLVLQTNGTTTAVTIGTNQVVTLAQPLPVASGGTNSTATPTAGGVGYGTGTAHAYTAAGTSGQVLTSAGSGAPTWSTPATGAMTLLTTINTATSQTTPQGTFYAISATGLASYNNYLVVFNNLKPRASGDAGAKLVVFVGYGATTYLSSTYGMTEIYSDNGGAPSAATSTSYFEIGRQSTSSTTFSNQFYSGYFYISGGNTGTQYTCQGTCGGFDSSASRWTATTNFSGSVLSSSNALTAILLTLNSANLGSGQVSVYGISS